MCDCLGMTEAYARSAARAVLALIPPQRCAPTEAEVAEAVAEASGGTVGTLTSRAQKIARAVLALFEGRLLDEIEAAAKGGE